MQNEPIEISSEEEEYKRNLEVLEMLDPEYLATLLSQEHPQTCALIVSALSHSSGAVKIIKALPENLQADVSYRILHLQPMPKTIIMEVFKILMKQLKTAGAMDAPSKNAGGNYFVQMLQNAEDDDASSVLAKLEETLEAGGHPSELLEKAKEKLKEGTSD
ncbi:MAG: hypothetical protein GY866_03705 [Proteobacteria bacterium]|nr:hypothetical protein [Pseudomonadota bacterium]